MQRKGHKFDLAKKEIMKSSERANIQSSRERPTNTSMTTNISERAC
jgi:hypothetical protein